MNKRLELHKNLCFTFFNEDDSEIPFFYISLLRPDLSWMYPILSGMYSLGCNVNQDPLIGWLLVSY